MTKKMVRNRPIRQVAHHEAAHAVIAYLLDCTLGPVSIVAKGQTKGRCEQARPRGVMAPTLVLDGAALRPMTDGERREWARRELDRRHATILAAGVSAEEKCAGEMPRPIYYFAGTNVLDDCFVESDVDEIMTIGGTVSRTPAGVLAYLDRARRRARRMLQAHKTWRAVEALAAELVERREMEGPDVTEIIESIVERKAVTGD